MPIAAGTRLGVYEFIARIGAGGMGEVYRGRDTKLNRDAALKILPDAFASDPDRVARFKREAQVLASLNHPHIALIYGLEESDGLSALALEFVDGPTLADRLIAGPIPISEALAIARQLADALDAAHTQGIVHRDLKPANIKVRDDGTVKVLDFGLAKPLDSPEADAANSPTLTALSRSGVILGTAAYMSPEQARGKVVDKRADIWAFGCVVYEMLSGVSPFTGETTTDTLAAVVGRDPDWSRLPNTTPPGLRALVQSALQKNPKRRLRDIGDAHMGLHDGSEAVTSLPRQRSRTTLVWQAVAVMAVIVAATLGMARWRGSSRAVERPRELSRLTSDKGLTTEPSISADGLLVAYASDRADGNLDIWVQQSGGAGGAVRLTDNPSDDRSPSMSPDGTLVAFRSNRSGGGIYVIPAFGGDARLIAPEGRVPKFSPDGRSIVYWTGTWLAVRGVQSNRRAYIIGVNGGTPVQVAGDLASVGDPVWSPDGTILLVHGRRGTTGADAQANWWIVPVNGGPSRPTNAYDVFRAAGLEVDDVDLQPYPTSWTADGVLFSATRNDDVRGVWRSSLDVASDRIGVPLGITQGTSWDEYPAATGNTIVFAGQSRRRLILGLPLDANAGRVLGDVRVVRSDVADVVRATITADGSRVTFPRFDATSGSVWVRDVASGRERQLTATKRTPLNPIISSDGTWVAYTVSAVDQGGNSGAGTGFVMPVEGGTPRRICDDCEVYQWLRSNKAVVALRRASGSIVVIDVGSLVEVPILSPSAENGISADALRPVGGPFSRPLVSYDERFISFITARQTYVAPFSPSALIAKTVWQPILRMVESGERTCGWSPDGKLLYFLLERDGFRCLYAVRIDPRTGGAGGEPFLVAHFHDASRAWGSTGFSSAVAQGVFLFNQYEFSGNIWMLK
jgi:serine/threonine protein kinase